MELVGYVVALLIGVSLGLIGSGGSILTLPIFIFLFGIEVQTATAYSLFVVGVAATVASIRYIRQQKVDFSIAFWFALPAMVTVYYMRKYGLPALPDIMDFGKVISLSKDNFIMSIFIIVLFISGLKMVSKPRISSKGIKSKQPRVKVLLIGVLVGLLSGLIGAGGGFIMVPVMVLMLGMPVKRAMATSLFIISVNTLFGFVGDVQTIKIDWILLLSVSAISVLGIYIGMYLALHSQPHKLKKGFGWFVLGMAIIISITHFMDM